MRGFLALALYVLSVTAIQAAECPYRTTTSCGLFGWFRCSTTKYRYCLHGGWSAWREVSRTTCSRSCNTGTQTVSYTRSCTNPSPYNGGNSCSGSSTKTETATCNTQRCPIHGGWSAYTETFRTPCSQSCGTGTLTITKTRSCSNPIPMYGGNNCIGSSTTTTTQSCNTQHCPIHGGWTQFTESSRTLCSKSCGNGSLVITKIRSCTYPTPAYGGNDCIGQSTTSLTESCNSHPCPIDGGWTVFTEASRTTCSKSCGTGSLVITKTRSCTNPAPRFGGQNCFGQNVTTVSEDCNPEPCPIDGGWSVWNDWQSLTKCTVMCGGGKINQTRDRACDNPAPRYGGRDCVGESQQNRTTACSEQECGDLCPENADTYLRADNDKYFYHCQQGQNNSVNTKAILLKCPPKTVWDQDGKACVMKAEPTQAPACVEAATRVDPTDCQYYLQCSYGSEIRMPCPLGTKFDQSLNVCNTAALVTC